MGFDYAPNKLEMAEWLMSGKKLTTLEGGFPLPLSNRMKTEVSHLQNVPIWMRQLWFQGVLHVQNNSTVIIWDSVLISAGRIFYSGVETIAVGKTISPLEKLNSGT